ncbi:Ig-like domain-containing protein, partial [Psychromonas sp. 14N.309.X.WAT.B.A12]|uniref:Ig-like domain-containing protein n=1 Tax=Psychromonas sp. 14N.309.X.WAT.B.A12 TaxID=2998322 RepID=UPI0025AF63FC
TNETSPALSGSIDDPTATVIVTVNAVEYTAVNNENGTWSLAADTLPDLTEGDVEVSVSASDEAGHSDSATTTIEIDTTAPVVSVDSIITNDTTPAITGTIDDPTAAVVVTVNDIEYTATNNANGTWTLADNTLPALDDGETIITVTASDAAGNSATNTGTVEVDTTGLNVSIDALVTNETSPALSGSIDDPTATVIVTVNAVEYTAVNNENGTWSLAADTLPDLTEGDVEVSVSASDEAGHSDSATTTIEIDTTAPVVSVDSIITNDTTPAITGTI